MKHRIFLRVSAVALCLTLTACLSVGPKPMPPDASFNYRASDPKLLLIVVGGNWECAGDKGLWPHRRRLADDVARLTGLRTTELSTRYFSWTGDPGGHEGCTPGPNRLDGERKILDTLKAAGELRPEVPIALVGWSNGGATAALLSRLIDSEGHPRVSLLVTLDPVSALTERKVDAAASVWLDVYTKSPITKKIDFGGLVAFVGLAWKSLRWTTVNHLYVRTPRRDVAHVAKHRRRKRIVGNMGAHL